MGEVASAKTRGRFFERAMARAVLLASAFPLLYESALSRRHRAAVRRLWKLRTWITASTLPALTAFFGIVLTFSVAELALRIPGLPLPYRLGGALFGCYDVSDDYHTIYTPQPLLDLLVMRPGYSTTCVFNRLRWHHDGDARGFRNPETWKHADVVLLGDSLTYGHGVEEPETVAHFLRGELGTTVVNLGTTAAGITDYLAFLPNYALPLTPKVVVVLVFANDIEDVGLKRSLERQQAFLAGVDVPELRTFPPDALQRALEPERGWDFAKVLRWVLTYQAFRFYEKEWTHPKPSTAPVTPVDPKTPVVHLEAGEEVAEVVGGGATAIEYTRKALEVMAKTAQAAGVALVIGYVPEVDDSDQRRDDAMERLLLEMTTALALPYMDLRPALSMPSGRAYPGDRLPIDGHLTGAGSQRAAREIARFLREKDLVPRP